MIGIEINGDKQWIHISGNENAPLLLFLHGGPSITSGIYLQEPFFKALEKDYLVAYWDQRGAGKSFSFKSLSKRTTSKQFVKDTKEVTRFLLKKYKRKKLVLFGFSYGAYMGIQAVNDCPWLYDYYIAIGQPVSNHKTVLEGYSFLQKIGEETNNLQLLKKLQKIGVPPYQKKRDYIRYRLLLDMYGGFKYQRKTNIVKDFLKPLFSAEIYSFSDKCKWLLGLSHSLVCMGVGDTDFEEIQISLKVPSLFISGEKDYITPISLTKDNLTQTQSEHYTFVVISKAAHDVHLEQPYDVLSQINYWKEKSVQNND